MGWDSKSGSGAPVKSIFQTELSSQSSQLLDDPNMSSEGLTSARQVKHYGSPQETDAAHRSRTSWPRSENRQKGGGGASDRTESQNPCFLRDHEAPGSQGAHSIGWEDISVTAFSRARL